MSKVYVPISAKIWWNDMPISGTYDRIVRAPVLYTISPPLLRRLRPRPLAMIEMEIARATLPAFRAEDV